MLDAGREVKTCMRVLAKSGTNLVAELIADATTFYEWDHYPKGEVYDSETHAQFYYHSHPERDRGREHGHFHTFLRPRGMPRAIAPAPLPDLVPAADGNAALSHLVGIGMDRFGAPLTLFATNRWVTGETWYRAPDVIRMLDFFAIDLARPSWPVNCWIGAMLRLFRPQIELLLYQRDSAIAAWQRKKPAVNAYEDRELAIAAEIPADIDPHIKAIEASLARRR